MQEEVTPGGVHLFFADSGISAPNGDAIQFQHDAAGRLNTVVGPDGTRVVYTYDQAGDLFSARNLVVGQSSRYGYGGAHLLTLVDVPAAGTGAVIQYAPLMATQAPTT